MTRYCCCISPRTAAIIVVALEAVGQFLANAYNDWPTNSTSIIVNVIAYLIIASLMLGIINRRSLGLWIYAVANAIVIALLVIVFVWSTVGFILMENESKVHTLNENAIHIIIVAIFQVTAVMAFITIGIRILYAIIVYKYICELRRADRMVCFEMNSMTHEFHKFTIV